MLTLDVFGKIFVVDLFIVHRFDGAHPDRMMDHQARQKVAIDQNNLVRMTLGEIYSGLREIRSRYKDPLCCFVRAETTAEIPDVGFANSVVRVVFLRLYIDAIEPQLVLVYDAVYPSVTSSAECTAGV